MGSFSRARAKEDTLGKLLEKMCATEEEDSGERSGAERKGARGIVGGDGGEERGSRGNFSNLGTRCTIGWG